MTAPAPAKGLRSLQTFLDGKKAVVAARMIARGERPAVADFDEYGCRLSAGEAAAFTDWLEQGLSTRVVDEVRSVDGSVRLVIGLHDGKRIESVAMPVGAACVSSQVGCAVGCRFCASGMFGVERQLDDDEIVEQVVHCRRRMRINRLVYMGMGEPTHNLDNVLTAAARISRELTIGPRRQTLSTVGSVRAFERMLAAEVRPNLALSLHLADDERRRELLPRAGKEPLRELVAAADAYGREVGNPVQVQYTLLAGVNDSDDDIDRLCDLLTGVRGYVNFIVYNRVDGLPYAAPERQRIVAIVRRTKQRDILATIRDSSGSDADAACGQLRLRRA